MDGGGVLACVYGGVADEISPCVYVVIGQSKEVGDSDGGCRFRKLWIECRL